MNVIPSNPIIPGLCAAPKSLPPPTLAPNCGREELEQTLSCHYIPTLINTTPIRRFLKASTLRVYVLEFPSSLTWKRCCCGTMDYEVGGLEGIAFVGVLHQGVGNEVPTQNIIIINSITRLVLNTHS